MRRCGWLVWPRRESSRFLNRRRSRNGEKFSFQVTIETHDQTGSVIAVYFRFRKGRSATVREYADGNVFADYNRRGELLGIEMLAPCKVSVLNDIAKITQAKEFIRKTIPRAMLAKT